MGKYPVAVISLTLQLKVLYMYRSQIVFIVVYADVLTAGYKIR